MTLASDLHESVEFIADERPMAKPGAATRTTAKSATSARTASRTTAARPAIDEDPARWARVLLDSTLSVAERSAALEQISADGIIRAVLTAYDHTTVAISSAFGPSGLCLIDMAQKVVPDVEVYFIDTGFSFAETDEVVTRWRGERGLNVKRMLPILTPDEQAIQHGPELWARDPDRCCRMRKIEPNLRALAGKLVWITALRRDQAETRAQIPLLQEVTLENGQTLLKVCPLARWRKSDVWRYIMQHELPYNQLHDRGYPSVGCTHCTHPVGDKANERDGRWAGRAKTECGLHTAPTSAKR
ncbi:MAG: phosphoadenylyl-sulfate reductase [Deltaproteobacteria bacterium]|nr:phosphoadenylyl-sulfate reductase [Deltaproteobacteria bacterium]